MKYRKNTTDEQVINEIFKKKVYDRCGFIDGDNWLDLGGHIGVFALYCKEKGIKNIYCYEPHPENYKYLVANIGKNCYNSAVYGRDKPEHLYVAKKESNTWRHSINKVRGREKIRIDSIHINDILKQHKIENVKIDVESAEYEILMYMNLEGINKIVFEFTSKLGYDKLLDIVNRLEFFDFIVKYPRSIGYPDSIIFAEKKLFF